MQRHWVIYCTQEEVQGKGQYHRQLSHRPHPPLPRPLLQLDLHQLGILQTLYKVLALHGILHRGRPGQLAKYIGLIAHTYSGSESS